MVLNLFEKIGVGVNNIVEGMKSQCDVIAQATCDERAVAEIINKYVLDILNNHSLKS